MVKGVSRQVVVVRSLDTRLFEQAIFMIRDGAMSRKGVTEEDILREANAAADAYLQENLGKRKGLLHWQQTAWAMLGAAVTGLAWILTALL